MIMSMFLEINTQAVWIELTHRNDIDVNGELEDYLESEFCLMDIMMIEQWRWEEEEFDIYKHL